METVDTPVTGVILAGGQSRRMGQNKALMFLGNDPLIVHVVRQMELVTTELLLITNEPDLYAALEMPMYEDIQPDMGALGGLHTGLTYATNSTVLCVGCDMPLLQPNLLSHLTTLLGDYDAVVPCVESSGPVYASYFKPCPLFTPSGVCPSLMGCCHRGSCAFMRCMIGLMPALYNPMNGGR